MQQTQTGKHRDRKPQRMQRSGQRPYYGVGLETNPSLHYSHADLMNVLHNGRAEAYTAMPCYLICRGRSHLLLSYICDCPCWSVKKPILRKSSISNHFTSLSVCTWTGPRLWESTEMWKVHKCPHQSVSLTGHQEAGQSNQCSDLFLIHTNTQSFVMQCTSTAISQWEYRNIISYWTIRKAFDANLKLT